jgi:hypothetical protein
MKVPLSRLAEFLTFSTKQNVVAYTLHLLSDVEGATLFSSGYSYAVVLREIVCMYVGVLISLWLFLFEAQSK